MCLEVDGRIASEWAANPKLRPGGGNFRVARQLPGSLKQQVSRNASNGFFDE
jgi:hypothetical protein